MVNNDLPFNDVVCSGDIEAIRRWTEDAPSNDGVLYTLKREPNPDLEVTEEEREFLGDALKPDANDD